MHFDLFLGIDYSGAQTPESRLKALQVYAARAGELPLKQLSGVVSATGKPRNWSRREIAQWLTGLAQQGTQFIAGIDHGFSFPQSYFERWLLEAQARDGLARYFDPPLTPPERQVAMREGWILGVT